MKPLNAKINNLFEDMQKQGIILDYALGGGIAAKYWSNPPVTKDVDIFVIVPYTSNELSLMQEVYMYMMQHRAIWVHQHLQLDNILLDILPAIGLVVEAVENAKEHIIIPDYLAAIAYFVGRKKDSERIQQFMEDGLLTENFRKIVQKWRK